MANSPIKRKAENGGGPPIKQQKIAGVNIESNQDEWLKQISSLLKTKDEALITSSYESYLSTYINDGQVWTEYIEYLFGKPDDKLDKKKIEQKFSEVLTKIYYVELWRLYLRYVQRINPITPDGGEKSRTIVLKSFDFALDTVGIDFLNGQGLWNDYLTYLHNWNTVNSNEESTKEDLMRKAIRKMITIPGLYLEDNWKLYTTFETECNQSKARKLIGEKSSEYMKLRPLNTELINLTKYLKEVRERKYFKSQLNYWNSWIQWEMENKLGLNSEELNKRINYVYRLSTQYCRLLPEVWYNYASYLSMDKQKANACLEIIKMGLIINPESFTLTFLLSSQFESKGEIEGIKKTWVKLIDKLMEKYDPNNLDDDLCRSITSCYSYLMTSVKRISGIKEARSIFSMARKFKGIKWNVFVDYALMEYQGNDLKIANRSFELAMKYFNKEVEFIISFLDFLINTKDLTNCKKTIELSLENFKDDKNALKLIFKKYFKIELEFGDINSINLLQKRFVQQFPDKSPFDITLTGFTSKYDNFNPVRFYDTYKPPIENPSVICLDEEDESTEKTNRLDDIASLATLEVSKDPFTVKDEIYNLLRVLPKAEYYFDKPLIFDPKKTVDFFKNLDI